MHNLDSVGFVGVHADRDFLIGCASIVGLRAVLLLECLQVESLQRLSGCMQSGAT